MFIFQTHVYPRECVGVCVCGGMLKRPDVVFGSSNFTLLFETGSLPEPGAC